MMKNKWQRPAEMLAAYLEEAHKITNRREPVPEPKKGEILVKVGAAGVCGSDVHLYEHGRIGPFVPTGPLVLGHESAGVVVEVGEDVTDLREGDRVALEPGVPCGRCETCKRGRYNLCPDVDFLGSPPQVHGAFREYMTFPTMTVFKLPDALSLEEGALMEPLGCGIYACRRGNIKPGDVVAVLGSGPIGLMICQVARASGGRVIISDVNRGRLEMAEKLGAERTVNVEEENMEEATAEMTGGRGADVVIEAAGTEATHHLALDLAAPGATVVFVGWLVNPRLPLDVHKIGVKELTIQGMFRYANIFPEGIAMVASGQVDLKSMITHRYPLAETEEAVRFAAKRGENTVKVVITPDGKAA